MHGLQSFKRDFVSRLKRSVVIQATHSCRHPRKRVTKYSREVAIESRIRGVLDQPLSRVTTTDDGINSYGDAEYQYGNPT
jgi:hypothetical protein